MSHTTSVEGIVFNDIEALKATIKELNTKGAKCELVKGGTPRAYYSNQAGMGAADYVIRLTDAPYDVGLYMDKVKKGLIAKTDIFGGYVAKVLGCGCVDGSASTTQLALGKLMSTYAVHAATRKAVQAGHTVRRVDNADGSVRLVVGVR